MKSQKLIPYEKWQKNLRVACTLKKALAIVCRLQQISYPVISTRLSTIISLLEVYSNGYMAVLSCIQK